MDENWNAEDLKSSDLSRSIEMIHLVAYPCPRMVDGFKPFEETNHWCLFLEFDEESSVRLEMTPGYGSDGLRGRVRLISKTHGCTSKAIHKVTYEIRSEVTLEDLINIVQTSDRQMYEFAAGWEGCRYWNFIFMKDLEQYGILLPGAGGRACYSMSYFYRSGTRAEERPMKPGTFLA